MAIFTLAKLSLFACYYHPYIMAGLVGRNIFWLSLINNGQTHLTPMETFKKQKWAWRTDGQSLLSLSTLVVFQLFHRRLESMPSIERFQIAKPRLNHYFDLRLKNLSLNKSPVMNVYTVRDKGTLSLCDCRQQPKGVEVRSTFIVSSISWLKHVG